MAKTVWTTERSSAKSRTTVSVAAAATGDPATAVSARTGASTEATARTTSVVVPEREMATTRS